MAGDNDVEGVDSRLLMSVVERVERLEEEKKGLSDDIKDIMAEAKAKGLEPKYIKRLIALRKQDPAERATEEQIFEVYKRAAGL
jgi:uncharacterized protein (UPF0335 family)